MPGEKVKEKTLQIETEKKKEKRRSPSTSSTRSSPSKSSSGSKATEGNALAAEMPKLPPIPKLRIVSEDNGHLDRITSAVETNSAQMLQMMQTMSAFMQGMSSNAAGGSTKRKAEEAEVTLQHQDEVSEVCYLVVCLMLMAGIQCRFLRIVSSLTMRKSRMSSLRTPMISRNLPCWTGLTLPP